MATYKEQLEQNNAKIEEIKKALENKVVGKGQLDITENGVHEVVGYETANVNIKNEQFNKLVDGTIERVDDINGDIKYVKSAAFSACYDLSYVNLPSASTIGGYAFYNCYNISAVDLNNTTSIYSNAFQLCTKMSEINIPNVFNLSENVFFSCYSLNSISINRMVRTASASCFYNCTTLKNIEMPYLYHISTNLFKGCSSLENVNINFLYNGLFSSAFESCVSLKSLSFYNITYIAANAFKNCTSFKSLYLYTNSVIRLSGSMSNNPMVNSSYLGYYGSIYVPESLVESYKSATNWTSLADRFVAIPYSQLNKVAGYQFRSETFTEIPSQFLNTNAVGDFGFGSCINLSEVELPKCEALFNYAFAGCYGLTKVSLPSLKVIQGSFAFANCSNLVSVYLPELSYFYTYTFAGCYSLKDFDCKNFTMINNATFSRCTSLSKLYNTDKVSYIYSGAFYQCRLESANFTNCTNIAESAFYQCSYLSFANFPKCTSIAYSAFTYCYRLLSLYLSGSTICSLASNAFTQTPIAGYSYYTSSVTGNVFVPESLVEAYRTATNWTSIASRIVGYNPDQQ